MKNIVITGRVTKDAVVENRQVGNETLPVSNFNVAVNTPTRKKDDQGRTIYKTDYYRISLWRGHTALAPFLKQGRRVNICGKNFTFETWMSRDGQVHPVCHITDPDIELADDRRVEAEEPPAAQTAAMEAPAEEAPVIDADELPFV